MENTYSIINGVCVIPDGTTILTGANDILATASAKSVKIPSSVIEIADRAFVYCFNLEEIVVEEGNPCYDSRGGCNAIIETSTNRLIAGSVTTIIPDTVTIIGDGAFEMRELTEIVIPDSVEIIEDRAFSFCANLHSVVLSKSLKSIGSKAFEECDISSLEIPASVESMVFDSFERGHLEYIRVDPANPIFDSRDGCNAIIITHINTLVCGSKNTVIPPTVEAIWERAFEYTDIEEISIPASVIWIYDYAFRYCLFLKKISIEKGPLKHLTESAFSGCLALEKLSLPVGIKKITASFDDCKLKEISVPRGKTGYYMRRLPEHLHNLIVERE